MLRQLEPYYQSFDLEFPYFKAKITEILREESDLLESVELAGRDALSEEKKLVLEVTTWTIKPIINDFSGCKDHSRGLPSARCLLAI